MEDIDLVKLNLDEDNSLAFEVKIEGNAAASTVDYRLVCKDKGMSFTFPGHIIDDAVTFNVPAMKQMLGEGLYDTHLEVIVNDRLLVPIRFKSSFELQTKVTVESIRANVEPKLRSSARIIEAAKVTAQKPIQHTQPPPRTIKEMIKPANKNIALKPTQKQEKTSKKFATLKQLYRSGKI